MINFYLLTLLLLFLFYGIPWNSGIDWKIDQNSLYLIAKENENDITISCNSKNADDIFNIKLSIQACVTQPYLSATYYLESVLRARTSFCRIISLYHTNATPMDKRVEIPRVMYAKGSTSARVKNARCIRAPYDQLKFAEQIHICVCMCINICMYLNIYGLK